MFINISYTKQFSAMIKFAMGYERNVVWTIASSSIYKAKVSICFLLASNFLLLCIEDPSKSLVKIIAWVLA